MLNIHLKKKRRVLYKLWYKYSRFRKGTRTENERKGEKE
jgi:hypothetical protein